MLEKYRQRVQDHIKRVQYFYGLLVNNGKIPVQEINLEGIINHDKDKLEEKNMLRQALRYKSDLTTEEMHQIHDVVMEHIKSNPHHCEYWGEGTYASKGIDCTKMTDIYLYEMCRLAIIIVLMLEPIRDPASTGLSFNMTMPRRIPPTAPTHINADRQPPRFSVFSTAFANSSTGAGVTVCFKKSFSAAE